MLTFYHGYPDLIITSYSRVQPYVEHLHLDLVEEIGRRKMDYGIQWWD